MTTDLRIFVSHSQHDDTFTDRLVADLRAAGADVWHAAGTSPSNEDPPWTEALDEALRSRSILLLVLSPAALESPYVTRAREEAARLGKAELTVLHRPCVMPAPLALAPTISFLPPRDYAEAFDGLLTELRFAARAQGAEVASPAIAPEDPFAQLLAREFAQMGDQPQSFEATEEAEASDVASVHATSAEAPDLAEDREQADSVDVAERGARPNWRAWDDPGDVPGWDWSLQQPTTRRQEGGTSMVATAVLEAIKTYASAKDLTYEVIDRQALAIPVETSNGHLVCFASVDAGDLVFESLYSFPVPKAKRMLVAEFVARVNRRITTGALNLALEDGEIGFKSGFALPSEPIGVESIAAVIERHLETADQLIPGLAAVCFLDIAPRDALDGPGPYSVDAVIDLANDLIDDE